MYYDCKFSKSLDDIWHEQDSDENGYLNKQEAREFLGKVANVVQEDRVKNY